MLLCNLTHCTSFFILHDSSLQCNTDLQTTLLYVCMYVFIYVHIYLFLYLLFVYLFMNRRSKSCPSHRPLPVVLWIDNRMPRPSPGWRTAVGGVSAAKGTGAFSCGFLRNGPLRWMRDWGPAANNHPPFWGRSARRGGAAGKKGTIISHLPAWRVSVCGWLCFKCRCRFVGPRFFRLWGGWDGVRQMGGGGQWLKKFFCLHKCFGVAYLIMTLQWVRS